MGSREHGACMMRFLIYFVCSPDGIDCGAAGSGMGDGLMEDRASYLNFFYSESGNFRCKIRANYQRLQVS